MSNKLKLTNKTTMQDLKDFCGEGQLRFWTGVTKVINKDGTDVIIEVDDVIQIDNEGFLTVIKDPTNK